MSVTTKEGVTDAQIAKAESGILRKIQTAQNNALKAGHALADHCYHNGHEGGFRRIAARAGMKAGTLHEWARHAILVQRLQHLSLPAECLKRANAAKELAHGFTFPKDWESEKLDRVLREYADQRETGPAASEIETARRVKGRKKATREARPAGTKKATDATAATGEKPKKEKPEQTVRRCFKDAILALTKCGDEDRANLIAFMVKELGNFDA